MKTIPLDLIRVLVIQQIDKLYYREGTKFSHRWVWKTKVREMNISYPTYMRVREAENRHRPLPEVGAQRSGLLLEPEFRA